MKPVGAQTETNEGERRGADDNVRGSRRERMEGVTADVVHSFSISALHSITPALIIRAQVFGNLRAKLRISALWWQEPGGRHGAGAGITACSNPPPSRRA